MRKGWGALVLGLVMVACGDKGVLSSEDDLSGNVPVTWMQESQQHAALFDDKTQKRGYAFTGVAGETISIFADGGNDLDTVVYIYEAMPKSGAPVGHYLARNDDTNRDGWTTNPLSSSIDSFVLPQDGSYVIVVRPYYTHTTGNATVWFSEDLPDVASIYFPASGSAVSRPGFSGVTASALPISNDALSFAKLASSDNFYSLARIKVSASDLKAILADANRLGAFAFDVSYYSGATPLSGTTSNYHGPSTVTAIAPTDAASTLDGAITKDASNGDRLRQADAVLTSSILGDGNFAKSTVKVFHTHWDNSDDTWSDAIVAADPATGEVRAVTYVSPP